MSIELRERMADAAGTTLTVLSTNAKYRAKAATNDSSSEGNGTASYGDTPTDKVS
jgi:hypothetical protein